MVFSICRCLREAEFKIVTLPTRQTAPPFVPAPTARRWRPWARTTGAAKDIGAGADGTVYISGGRDTVWRWKAAKKNWDRFGSALLTRLDPDGPDRAVGHPTES